MPGPKIKSETQTNLKRLIYFTGHPKIADSKLITRVCADYETVSKLFCGTGECASRTMSNLYNLHTCRGVVITNPDTQKLDLELESSMSGPHHYLGHIDPRDYITIHIPLQQNGPSTEYGLPIYTSYSSDTNFDFLDAQQPNDTDTPILQTMKTKTKIPCENILTLSDYMWIPGKELTGPLKKRYGLKNNSANNSDIPVELKFIDTNTGLESDSLFPNPGILELPMSEIRLKIIDPDPDTNGGLEYDFACFGAQLVPNQQPWQFNQVGIQTNQHARHKLRLITYYYGRDYVNKYLLPRGGSGLFIERHEFIQAITPINPDCGGFVILGQELKTWTGRKIGLELIGVRIPFGYTLLVEPWAIHGDSNLIGLYSMAMTGNHLAMATADTVFLKNHNNGGNVRVVGVMNPDANTSNKIVATQLSGQQKLLINSDQLSQDELNILDIKLKQEIRCGISWLESWYFQPVIWNPFISFKIPNT
jgi:hypothetical protein